MNNICQKLLLCTALACSIAPRNLTAQETSLSGTPSRTLIKARTDSITLTATPLKAFTTTSVTCATQCFLDITVSAQFSGVTEGDVAIVEVNLDGSQTNVLPFSVLGFDSTSTGAASNARAYTWMTGTLSAGKHSIDVFFFTDAGTAQSFDRTLKVVVNK